jgi:thymidylate synthase (FAD)
MTADENPFGINITKRLVSPGAEQLLYHKQSLERPEYQSGFVEVVDYMGGDDMVVRAATSGLGLSAFKENPERADFLQHLAWMRLDQPFRSTQLKIFMKMPIEGGLTFVYDENISVNEYSGRYSEMINSANIPSIERIAAELTGSDVEQRAEAIYKILSDRREESYNSYLKLSSKEDVGLTRELARVVLGVDNDTQFFWKTDLYNLAQFVEKHRRQKGLHEITRDYVELAAEAAQKLAPEAWDALTVPRQRRLHLTYPTDAEIVDPDLAPASWQPTKTKRATVPDLEDTLFKQTPYLEHGGFQVVDYMGNNDAPAEAARTSYGRGTKKVSNNKRLTRTLIRGRHTSPLEMAVLAMETKALVFVDPRQAGRHRTLKFTGFMGTQPIGSEFYVPPAHELRLQSLEEHQGRGEVLDEERKKGAKKLLDETYAMQAESVEQLRTLGAPERLVRAGLGVGSYTKTWRIGDIHNICHFLGLRLDSHAQKEIQQLADPISEAVRLLAPDVHQALLDYHPNLGAELISRHGYEHLGNLLQEAGAFNLIDPENITTYKGSKMVVKVKNQETGKFEPGLGREGDAFKKQLRRLRDTKK